LKFYQIQIGASANLADCAWTQSGQEPNCPMPENADVENQHIITFHNMP
jgi:hypothetical protein